MNQLNFETILVIVILVFTAVTTWTTIQRMRKLGEMVKGTLSGIKYSDKMQFILITLLAFFTFFTFQMNLTENNYINIFNIAFILIIVIFLFNTAYIALTPKGFFKNGISTYSGVLSYEDVVNYEVVSRPKNNTIRIRFNPKKSIFGGNGSYIDISPSEEAEIKAYLKKHCSFKKKSYTPPPKKKK